MQWWLRRKDHKYKVLQCVVTAQGRRMSTSNDTATTQNAPVSRAETEKSKDTVIYGVTEMCTMPILVRKTLTARGSGCCGLAGGRLSDWSSRLRFSRCSAGFCDFNEGHGPWAHSVAAGQNAVYYGRVRRSHTGIRTSVGLFGGNTKVHYTLNIHLEKQHNRV